MSSCCYAIALCFLTKDLQIPQGLQAFRVNVHSSCFNRKEFKDTTAMLQFQYLQALTMSQKYHWFNGAVYRNAYISIYMPPAPEYAPEDHILVFFLS